MLYASTSSPAVLTTANVVKAMNDYSEDDTIIREFCVKKITAWNTTSAAKTTNYIRGRTYSACTTNGVEIYGEDFGTASSLPGVTFEIPDALSQLQKANGSSTTGLADFVPYPLGGDFTDKQTFCLDVFVNVLVL